MSVENNDTPFTSNWDEAAAFCGLLVKRLSAMNSIVTQSAEPNIIAHADNEALLRDAHLLKADLPTFIERIKEIAHLHSGKTGLVQDIDENMELINIVSSYESVNHDIDLVIEPTFLSISDNVSRALQKHIDTVNKTVTTGAN